MNIREFWIQVIELTSASMKSRYRKTWAGFVWVLMNPILMFGVQSLVFKKFLKIDIPDYFVFLLGGLLPWIFITSTVQMGTPVFAVQAQLLRAFKINPLVLIGAQVLDGFINFVASLVLIMLPLYLFSDKPLLPLAFIPLALLPLLLGTLCLTVTLCLLNVFYRDINFVIGFAFSLLFFLTPIFYPKEFVPPDLHLLLHFNPILYLIDPFRSLIYNDNIPEFFLLLGKSSLVAILILIVSVLTWKRKVNDFYRKL